ncbi:diadenylate cyclase [Nocardioides sp. WL0053]|uniref:Diadenylate cyclase n=1 Tax=Nocardioides jiangsuensis TaxID=2866161 RepID=A0ABS7RGD9_9ACTN|nr:diadenylate cyclase [Nocardioides jiangsuensis]MBY9074104.1 diadenylate cyclase [Nocardioides jiangsuensis]
MSDPSPSQTMWGFQHHFRISLDSAADRALDQIGAILSPDAFLVGFPSDGVDPAEVRLEAREGLARRFTAADFAEVSIDAKRRYEESPVHDLRFPSEEMHEARHEYFRDTARAAAVEAAMQQAPAGQGRTFFVGQSAPVGDFEVHPVLSVDSENIDALPRLETSSIDGVPLTVSLAHGIISELLRTATHALLAAKPPRTISPLEDDVPTDAIRRSANHLVFSTAMIAGETLAKGLFDSFEALASTAYEGRAGAGSVILASDGHPHVDVAVRLRVPISVRERLQFRKLLEISGPDLSLLVDGTTIYGLGGVSPEYDGSTEDVFRFSIIEQGIWMMSHHGSPLLRVANGHPQLPRPRMSPSLFVDSMRRVFASVSDDNIRSIWRLAQTAVGQSKGTMLVVTTAAAQEAKRLAPQALAIEPQTIDSALLRSLTKIDGAVLLTPDGTCHAVGVILDGIATGVGDPGRGARYNSAVRYTAASSAPCLIVIVSEDGMIDVHPELAPRVRPEDVEQALYDLETIGGAEDVNLESFYAARERLRVFAFYLSESQCNRANQVVARVEQQRFQQTGMRLAVVPFAPDPRMNESFFSA